MEQMSRTSEEQSFVAKLSQEWMWRLSFDDAVASGLIAFGA